MQNLGEMDERGTMILDAPCNLFMTIQEDEQMAIHPNGKAPYAPPKTIIDIVETYREKDMRKPWDLQVLEQAGVSESLAPRTLQALKLLDIIGADGNPTEQFEALVRAPDTEFKQGLADLFCAAYGDILAFADPSINDISRIRDAFRPYQPRGQQERMITLFIGLLEYAGVDVSAAKVSSRPKVEKKAGAASSRATKKPRKPKPDPNTQNGNKPDPAGESGSKPPAVSGVFGIPDSDLALLNEDEFDEVWAALGSLAKAKARAIRAKDSGIATKTAHVEKEE